MAKSFRDVLLNEENTENESDNSNKYAIENIQKMFKELSEIESKVNKFEWNKLGMHIKKMFNELSSLEARVKYKVRLHNGKQFSKKKD